MSVRDKYSYRMDRKYKKVRLEVLKRDKYKCKQCGSNKFVQVHHIKKWADYPTLRYEVSNMIALCRACHRKLWGKEEDWEGYCLLLMNKERALDVQYLMWKLREEEEDDDE